MADTETDVKKWERAIPILTFLFVVVGGIWFGGGEWRAMRDKIEWLVTENQEISTEVTRVRLRIEAIEQGNIRRRQSGPFESSNPETPQFESGGSVR